jgi:hypothetical protein
MFCRPSTADVASGPQDRTVFLSVNSQSMSVNCELGITFLSRFLIDNV